MMWQVGRLSLAGLTFDQAAARVRDEYIQREVYRTPTVLVSQARPVCGWDSLIQVSGEVKRPGGFPYERGLTLSQILQSSKVKTSWPVLEVTVWRSGLSYSLVPYSRSRFGNERVYPGDVIEVKRDSNPWVWIGAKKPKARNISIENYLRFRRQNSGIQ